MDPAKRMKKMLMSWIVIMVMICFMALTGGSLVKVKKQRAYPHVTPAPAQEKKFVPMKPIRKINPPIMYVGGK